LTPHVSGRLSWGYTMVDKGTGGTVMFTCDSIMSRKNIDLYGRDADLIFHDCQFLGNEHSVHTLLSDLLELPDEIQERIILIHYGDAWKSFADKIGLMRLARETDSFTL
jgi:ribonuclease BN (tRNA processing enzyme)